MNLVRIFLLANIRVHGRENIPESGPYIVVLNHTSVVDTPVLLISFPIMKWRFFAVDKWRSHLIYGPIMAWLGAIYIKREGGDRKTLREALEALRSGFVFGLAPEGTRSLKGSLMPAKDGAAYLASRAKVPILPVGLVNNDILFANVKRLCRTQIDVCIGKPFLLPETERRAKGRKLAAYTHLLMIHIAAQLPKRYHGYYIDSPALKALLDGEDPWPYCQRLVATQNRFLQ